MGRKQSPALFVVVALLLSAAATPPVHGQPLSAFALNGRLCCTSTGNCPGGQGIPQVLITMGCSTSGIGAGSGYVFVGQTITGIDGSFTISVNNVTNLVTIVGNLLALPCTTTFFLDPGVCPILNATNVIGYPTLINTVLTLFGLVGNYWTQWMPTSP